GAAIASAAVQRARDAKRAPSISDRSTVPPSIGSGIARANRAMSTGVVVVAAPSVPKPSSDSGRDSEPRSAPGCADAVAARPRPRRAVLLALAVIAAIATIGAWFAIV